MMFPTFYSLNRQGGLQAGPARDGASLESDNHDASNARIT